MPDHHPDEGDPAEEIEQRVAPGGPGRGVKIERYSPDLGRA